jgi:hypothetical protein
MKPDEGTRVCKEVRLDPKAAGVGLGSEGPAAALSYRLYPFVF